MLPRITNINSTASILRRTLNYLIPIQLTSWPKINNSQERALHDSGKAQMNPEMKMGFKTEKSLEKKMNPEMKSPEMDRNPEMKISPEIDMNPEMKISPEIDMNPEIKDAPLLPSSLTKARDIAGIPKAMSASYWDAKSQLEQDYIIVGGGIIGLTTAISLKQQEPDARVLVLERGVLPSGASSRNAGFACFGSLTEILEDIAVMGTQKAMEQIQDRWEGLQLLRRSLGDQAIGFSQTGNVELISSELLPQLQHLKKINTLLRPIFADDVFVRIDDNIELFGFSKKYVSALVLNQFEGQLDSGKMMQALQQKAQSLGVMVRFGSCADRPRNCVGGLEVLVKNQQGGPILFRTKAAAICTNGYTSHLLPEFKITPGRGQIIVTEPFEKPLPFNAPCHIGKGFWYFRTLPDNRILLGGGRHLNFSQETTTELNTTPDILGPLKAILKKVIVPGHDPRIEYSWAGLMGFSPDHLPKIEKVPGQPHLMIGFGCNGMGVARGFRTGQKTAALLKANRAPVAKPVLIREDPIDEGEVSTSKARFR
jgi:glycine/D-amino acid oxidase-like deaminating enzyme